VGTVGVGAGPYANRLRQFWVTWRAVLGFRVWSQFTSPCSSQPEIAGREVLEGTPADVAWKRAALSTPLILRRSTL